MNPVARILVVEDEPEIRELLGRLLVRAGYEVKVADDGQSGWEIFSQEEFDLIITDNRMPRLTGLELIQKVFQSDQNIPVILACASLGQDEERELDGLRSVSRLTKPFRLQELLNAVKSTLELVPGK